MRPPIDGGVALVTGASSGIGQEIARQLSPRAGAIILVARRRERLEKLADELRRHTEKLIVEVQVCDLTDRVALTALADDVLSRYDVDILVNCAGLGDVGMFDLASWDKTEYMIELNTRALTYLTHRFVAPMVARKRGGILMMSSGFGLTFMPAFAAYVGTKHYVSGFSECLRLELRHTGVVVTHVCPGPVATEFYKVAGNPIGAEPQRYIEISAAACARTALAGFSRGKALVLTGIAGRIIIRLGLMTPRWMLRLLYSPLAAWGRQRQYEGASRV
jgi:uncharacterized protein